MNTNPFIKAVKDHALANYGKQGWDSIIECWSDREIELAIKDCKTEKAAINKIGFFANLWYEQLLNASE